MKSVVFGVQLVLCVFLFFVRNVAPVPTQGAGTSQSGAGSFRRSEPFSREHCEEIFKKFDVDGDNALNAEELGNALKEFGQELSASEILDVIGTADVNNDKKLQFGEYYALVAGVSGPMSPEEMKTVFRIFDRNGDGSITPEELYETLKKMGVPCMDLEEAKAMIAGVDEDGNGLVDIHEFQTMMQKGKFGSRK